MSDENLPGDDSATPEETPETPAAPEAETAGAEPDVAPAAGADSETASAGTVEAGTEALADSAADDEPVPVVPGAGDTADAGAAEGADGEALPELTLGGEGVDEGPVRDPNWQPVIRGKLDKDGTALGTGRRKTAVARVRIKSGGSGAFKVNGREIDDYFTVERDRRMIMAPLEATEQAGQVDISVRVNGGGSTGQTGAIVLGIARALTAIDANFHHALSDGGYLTRDDRMVERKKYGFKKARKSFQFSKR